MYVFSFFDMNCDSSPNPHLHFRTDKENKAPQEKEIAILSGEHRKE